MDTVYCSGSIQIKISYGKGAYSRGQEDEDQRFQLPFLSGIMWTILISLKNNVWQYSICTVSQGLSQETCYSEVLLDIGHIYKDNGTPLQYSCLENPWTEEPGRLQSMGLRRVGHDWATSLSLFTFMHCRRKWQPTPVFLPGESQGQGSLVGCHLWGRTESDMTEVT